MSQIVKEEKLVYTKNIITNVNIVCILFAKNWKA